ncbi:hypothetical protein ACTXNJ_21940 [Pseudomonas helleri]|uniref:hypothetical protein n=1 Tax=Pseudomonas helleri TaxID=1608996 RepID=UPI003FD4A1F3
MKKLLLLLGVLALSGCAAQAPTLVTKTDQYTKEQQYRLGDIYPANCPGDSQFYYSVQVSFLGGGDTHALNIEYIGPSWKFLDSKQGLDLLVDGVPMKLKGVPGSSTDVGNYGVKEDVYFFMNREIATKLANANTIQMRVLGSKGLIEKCLNKTEINEIAKIIPYLR